MHARPIGPERLDQAVFHRALITYRCHVDEIDDDQAANVSQSQLAGDLNSRLEIRIKSGFLDVSVV